MIFLHGGLFQQFAFHLNIIWESLEIKKTKCMTLSFIIICFRSLYGKEHVKYAVIFCYKRKKSYCKTIEKNRHDPKNSLLCSFGFGHGGELVLLLFRSFRLFFRRQLVQRRQLDSAGRRSTSAGRTRLPQRDLLHLLFQLLQPLLHQLPLHALELRRTGSGCVGVGAILAAGVAFLRLFQFDGERIFRVRRIVVAVALTLTVFL